MNEPVNDWDDVRDPDDAPQHHVATVEEDDDPERHAGTVAVEEVGV